MEYDKMFSAQGGVCAACYKPEESKDKRYGTTRNLAVDHCHATGKIRGLLCIRCNLCLGTLKDDRDLLLRLAEYLNCGIQN